MIRPEEVNTISDDGIDFIKDAEGFRDEPYDDVGGRSTIGYGHLIKPGESFTKITQEEGEAILRDDVKEAETCINKWVRVGLSQCEFDALCSFVFNLGCRNFVSSTLLKKINLSDFEEASYEFMRWVYAGGKVCDGIVARRQREKELFLGMYP